SSATVGCFGTSFRSLREFFLWPTFPFRSQDTLMIPHDRNAADLLPWLVDRQSDLLDFSAKARGIDATYAKALTMLTAPRIKRAFDLSAEPASVRDRYGRTTYGQSCLLARRLVEAGAKFINVYFSATIGGQSNQG